MKKKKNRIQEHYKAAVLISLNFWMKRALTRDKDETFQRQNALNVTKHPR